MTAFVTTGKPKPKIKPVGSFERWTIAVGGILENARIKGFMENAAAMYQEADEESRQWEGFLLVLHDVFYGEAFTVADIVEKMNGKTAVPGSFGSEPTAHAKELKGSLPGFLAEAMDRPDFFRHRMGHAFSARVDRRFGESGVHLKKGTILNGRQQWEVAIPALAS